jgi:hypothetical protein
MTVITKAQSGGKIRWLCLTFLAFILALGLSWMISMPLNFGYESLYGLIDIDQHITRYAPMNLTKYGFGLTTEPERYRLFAEIVRSIHHQGEGLASLVYLDPQGKPLQTLFTHDEVVHLQDVAILIDRMKWLLGAALALFIMLFIWLYRTRTAMPSFKALLAYVFISLLLATGVILLIGAHDVFYQLHVWVFPEEHKWFFYYEESLMSTMMKAPDLFAYIAALLVGLGVIIFVFIMWLLRQIFISRAVSHA